MKSKSFIPSFFLMLGVLGPLAENAHGQCPVLGEVDRARLVDYVQKKYKPPVSSKLDIGDTSFVGSTCYRKLVFLSPVGPSPFRLELIASPDLRFLSKELLDSTVDPVVEEKQKADAFVALLGRGKPPVRGRQDAPVTIAVFSDFQCPYCARFAAVMKDVLPAEASEARLTFYNLPLAMHPWARPAAEAAACAQQQGNEYFWALHDFIFDRQKDLNRDNLLGKLADLTKTLSGFDQGKFAACAIERQTAAQVERDMALAQQNGIEATPTVFVNGRRTQVTAPEQMRTLIRQLSEDAENEPAAVDAASRAISPKRDR